MPAPRLLAVATLIVFSMVPTDTEARGRWRCRQAQRCCPPPVCCSVAPACGPVTPEDPAACGGCTGEPTSTMPEAPAATEETEITLEAAPPAPVAEDEQPTVMEPAVESPTLIAAAESASESTPAPETSEQPVAESVAVEDGPAVAAAADPGFEFPYTGRPAPQLAAETTAETAEDEDDPNRCHWRGWYKCGEDDVWHDFWGNGSDCGEALSDALDWAESLCGANVAYNPYDCNCD